MQEDLIKDGVIKYTINWENAACIAAETIADLEHYRHLLWQHKLIGEDERGYGYGNISKRCGANSAHFIISGTQTGRKEWLSPNEYAKVTYWNIKNNLAFCKGKIKASSEALTHANLYANFTDCQVVIHIHSHRIWHDYYNILPTTDSKIVYGTPEMAQTVQFLFTQSRNSYLNNILIMGGHQDGILAWGDDFEQVVNAILAL
ncbi:MAG: hypothetical protein RI894_244 [Bacteroidota bacterium]|jgi:actin-related protein